MASGPLSLTSIQPMRTELRNVEAGLSSTSAKQGLREPQLMRFWVGGP